MTSALLLAALVASPAVTEHRIHTAGVGIQHVVVIAPKDAGPDRRYPGLVALSGLGEARRGNKAGAWGWVEKYGLLPALEALAQGRLGEADTQRLIRGTELAAWNAALARHPYRGLIIVCPFPSKSKRHHRWVVDELLPWAEREVHVAPGRWGVDGISLGGGVAAVVGFAHPEVFASIGSLQGAITAKRRPAIERSIQRWGDPPSRPAIQIVTSRGDGFRPALTDFHRWLERRQVAHTFEVLPGRHDKAFVRGPGVLRMLMFHDQALRQGPP